MAKLTKEQLKAVREQKRKADEAWKLARKLTGDSGRDVDAERRRMAERKTAERQAAATIVIPPCADRERRELLESDDAEWLLYYFGDGCGLDDPFTYQFTEQQRDMLDAIGHAIKYGDDQAIAASRGEGKTTLTERRVLKSILTGEADYVVLFASTGPMAENILDSLDTALTENDRLLEDYPEVCVPVRELMGAPQRANTQRATGHRHDNGEPYEMAEIAYKWCGNELIFPNVPGSPSARHIIATRGLDAAVRGLKKRGKRPKLAIIDDPDTEDTARSEEQARKLEKRIDAAIGGLGGQRRSVGRVLLTTLQSRIAVSYKYTDPKQKPTFKGRRYRFLVSPPSNPTLADEYVQMRLEDLQRRDENGIDLDPFARRSHAFWLANRDKIEAGAVVSNPNRFEGDILPDGTQKECGAIQHYYNLIAKLGPEVVATEYDNDPPEEANFTESAISPSRIQRQVSGFERRVIPPGCTVITAGVDCRKVALHWVVRAWQPDGTGYVLDYGIWEVHGTRYGSDEGLDEAVRKAILGLSEQLKDAEWMTSDGELKPIDLMLVDAGWRTDAVYAACHEIGLGIMPVMGFGRSSGCTYANFSDQQRRTTDKKPGDGWFLSRKGKLWLVGADADRWKAWEHDRWMTSPEKPGSLMLFGQGSADATQRMTDDEKAHHSYARHICNEVEVEELHKGTLRRIWKAKSENTHWLDASYYSNVAANIKGIRLSSSAPPKATEATTNNTAAATVEKSVARQQAERRQPVVANGGSWFAQAKRR